MSAAMTSTRPTMSIFILDISTGSRVIRRQEDAPGEHIPRGRWELERTGEMSLSVTVLSTALRPGSDLNLCCSLVATDLQH
jgi:hypothetical protein